MMVLLIAAVLLVGVASLLGKEAPGLQRPQVIFVHSEAPQQGGRGCLVLALAGLLLLLVLQVFPGG
jgi:hypothetical protein